MQFEQTSFEILGQKFSQDSLEGMTSFPSFYEPFLRLDKSAGKEKQYKCLGERVPMPDVTYTITEKVDGTNCAILGWHDGKEPHLLIRGREELLAYSKDHIWSNRDEIITTLNPQIPQIAQTMTREFPDQLWMLCMELYGPGIQKRGEGYGPKKNARVFSVRTFNQAQVRLFSEADRLKYDPLRRVNKHVPFLPHDSVEEIATKCGLKTAPMLGTIEGKTLQTPADVVALLKNYAASRTAQEDGGSVESEGVVLWSQADYNHPKAGNVLAVFKLKPVDYPRPN